MADASAAKPGRPPSLAQRLRALLRRSESILILLGFLCGAAAGLFAAGILWASVKLHEAFFGHERVSAIARLDSPWQALVPAAGGLILGVAGIFILRWRKERPVDPIEANALRGGRMSLADSAVIVGQTVVSNGFGASVGLEAAYTQMGSGFASTLGSLLGLRRADLRTLVACGAAGAIAAAFAAPLTGAFYAFELVLGAYTPFGLAPVGAAAIAGALVASLLGSAGDFVKLPDPVASPVEGDMALLLLLAVICAGFGIAIMRGVTLVETLFQASGLPRPLHPLAGGLIVGALAFVSPHVLSSGHGATIALFDDAQPALAVLALAVAAKSAASAVSIGSGFRGGLFFASLYLGSLIGWMFSQAVALVLPHAPIDGWTSAIVGMVSLAVAIVGGPLTMSFLALETTRNLALTLVILMATTLASIVVRRGFGYSFATWRLHLRGESIRSAQDVSWMRDLTVARLMRPDVAAAPLAMRLADFVVRFPLGAAQWVVGVDEDGRYGGVVFVPDSHVLAARDGGTAALATIVRQPDHVLCADMNAKAAAQIFENAEAEALAVVDAQRRPVGLVTEAHLLRRYAEELDKARRELAGDLQAARRD